MVYEDVVHRFLDASGVGNDFLGCELNDLKCWVVKKKIVRGV